MLMRCRLRQERAVAIRYPQEALTRSKERLARRLVVVVAVLMRCRLRQERAVAIRYPQEGLTRSPTPSPQVAIRLVFFVAIAVIVVLVRCRIRQERAAYEGLR